MFRLALNCGFCKKDFQGSITQVVSSVYCPHCHREIPFPNSPAGEPVWLVAQGKQKVGPFSTSHLAQLASSSQLSPEHMVLLDGSTKWRPAQSVPGLLVETVKRATLADTSDDIFADPRNRTPQGPLSIKGIKVRANFSLTLGDFQIFRKLGAGGMGAVYLALQRSLDRLVALKVLSEAHAGQDTFVNRFHREIALLATLDHPNIVKFIGAGEEKGIPFFAMEFIEGYSSSALVKHAGKLAVSDALFIICRACDALDYALAHRVVHRDIKPENIMITQLGDVKIADLGLAKSLEESDLDLTDTGTGLGSPKYMAPEQSRDAKRADHRSDIYALGGVLYYLLTGHEPFKGTTTLDLLLAKEAGRFTPARKLNHAVPPRLDLIVDKMLSKEPKYRYQAYGELIGDLASLGILRECLSFDAAQVVPIERALAPQDLIEILLIDNDLDDIRLAQLALEENHIHGNLVVVKDGAEARAFLRHEGKFLLAPLPNLIIFGSGLNSADSLLTLAEIRISDMLQKIPLVILAATPETAQFFEAHGFKVKVIGNVPDDPHQFESFFKSIQGMCLTVMELTTFT